MFHELHALFNLYAEKRKKKNKNNEINRGPKKSLYMNNHFSFNLNPRANLNPKPNPYPNPNPYFWILFFGGMSGYWSDYLKKSLIIV